MEGHQGTKWVQYLLQTTVLVGQSFEPFKKTGFVEGSDQTPTDKYISPHGVKMRQLKDVTPVARSIILLLAFYGQAMHQIITSYSHLSARYVHLV